MSGKLKQFDWKGQHFDLLKELAIEMTNLLEKMVSGENVSPTTLLHKFLEEKVNERNLNVIIAKNVVPGLMHHTDGQFIKFGFDARIKSWANVDEKTALKKLGIFRDYFKGNWTYSEGRSNTTDLKIKISKLEKFDPSNKLSSSPIYNYTANIIDQIKELLKYDRNIILTGVPGTGKTFIAKEFAKSVIPNNFLFVQFHPSYSYEEFIEGYFPTKVDDKTNKISLKQGKLRFFLENITREKQSILVIDEINRGNIPEIFGELLYALEYREQEFTTMYSNEKLSIPSNLIVIGTMNSSDRNIAIMDFALRRRFKFVEITPDFDLLYNWMEERGIDEQLREAVQYNMNKLNEIIIKQKILGIDNIFGHSYFMKSSITIDECYYIWNYQIIPMLIEYCYGDKSIVYKMLLEIPMYGKYFDSLDDNEKIEFQMGNNRIPINQFKVLFYTSE